MTRVERRVLQMNDPELQAVIAVAMPGRKIDGLRRDERQEICMKWLFGNGLSMNHKFTLDIEDDDIYVLMSNKHSCTCCPKDVENSTVTLRSFDKTPIGSSMATFVNNENGGNVQLALNGRRNSYSVPNMNNLQPNVHGRRSKSDDNILSSESSQASLSDRRGHKVKPITSQPKQNTMPPPRKPVLEPEKDEGCWRTFWREYGTCCVGLWSNC